LLICQVQDVEGARQAIAAGADLLVAQGTEAGGHGKQRRATLPLVPAVADVAGDIPVLAAGGIADGRGLAAALMLGAAGVLVGTRFWASPEALGAAAAKDLLVRASGDQTLRTGVFDVVRQLDWPEGYSGRAITNAFTARWHGREAALATDLQQASEKYWTAARAGDVSEAVVFAGEGLDLIHAIQPAGDIVRQMAEDAERLLRNAPAFFSIPA